MESRTEIIPLKLPDGREVKIEATPIGEEDVAFDIRPFEEVTDAIEGIAEAIIASLQKVKPDKASVKFGLEVAIESGQLTALIVKGASKANLEITLEWGK